MTVRAKELVAWERDRDARRSLAEYEVWKKHRRIRLGLDPPPPEDDLRELNGWVHEVETVMQRLAADLGDTDVSRAVAASVTGTVALGNLLARRRAAHAD